MKIIKTNREIFLEFQTDSNNIIRLVLLNNKKYVMSDGVCQNTTQLYGNNALDIEQDFKELKNRYTGQDLSNKSLISIREGGAGDLLFKTPVFKYLKETYPNCKIGLSCSPIYHSLFINNPVIDDVYIHVLPLEAFQKYDYFSTFEGVIEQNKEAEYKNAYDLYAEKFGVDSKLLHKTPILKISQLTLDYWKCVLGNDLSRSKKIGFQWRASSPVRTLPFVLSAHIIHKLTDLGHTVFILDAIWRKNDVAKFVADNNLKVIDTSKFSDNFERMAGIISLMDMFIGGDSSGTHIAAGLGKPLVGFYGPFRSELRLKYYKNAMGIDVMAQRCNNGRGCYSHTYSLCNFALELGERSAPCWRLLDVDMSVKAIDAFYKEIYGEK